MGMAGRDLLPVMESVHAPNHRQAMIHGLWCRLGALIQLMARVSRKQLKVERRFRLIL
jgi:hypothetical protein